MKTFSVKLLVALLSLVLVLSVACLFASAEETDVMTQAETTEEISTTPEMVSEQATVMETEETNAEDATDAETSEEINFRPAGFVENLKYMAAGMAGIFIVIGAIILCIVILGKVTDKKKNDEE